MSNINNKIGRSLSGYKPLVVKNMFSNCSVPLSKYYCLLTLMDSRVLIERCLLFDICSRLSAFQKRVSKGVAVGLYRQLYFLVKGSGVSLLTTTGHVARPWVVTRLENSDNQFIENLCQRPYLKRKVYVGFY